VNRRALPSFFARIGLRKPIDVWLSEEVIKLKEFISLLEGSNHRRTMFLLAFDGIGMSFETSCRDIHHLLLLIYIYNSGHSIKESKVIFPKDKY
jgi:hypothetical protein